MLGLSFICLVLFASLLLRAFAIGNSALFLSRVFILALGVCIGGMYSLALGALTEFFDSSQSRYFANITVLSGVAGAVLLPFTFGLISNQIGLDSATVFILVLLTGMFTGAGLLFYASRRERSISHSM